MPAHKGKVLFVLHPKHGHATAKIRGTIYEDVLRNHGWFVTYVTISKTIYSPELDQFRKTKAEIVSMAASYDIIYLIKVNAYGFIKKIRKNTQAKIIFDLTDALWRRNFRKSWIFLEDIMRLSDAVFSENEYVCEYGRKYNEHVFSLAACTQTEKFDEERKKICPRNDKTIVIGWIGSEPTITAIYSIVRPLERLFLRYSNLELRLLGAQDKHLKKHLKNIRYSVLSQYSEEEMIREALSMDIGLFPPPRDIEDYRVRGALKGMIYMSAAIPAVCFNAGDSSKMITDGVNGVLINNESEWETKTEKLILDPGLRKKIGRLGYEFIVQEHSLEKVGSELSKAFSEVLKLKRRQKSKISVFQKAQILTTTLFSN
jgi:glycosyltransferase involved in cell wall biosynthesis